MWADTYKIGLDLEVILHVSTFFTSYNTVFGQIKCFTASIARGNRRRKVDFVYG
jgi:hypothetical protein